MATADEERILREAQRICADDGSGIQVTGVSLLGEGASDGFAVNLAVPQGISPSGDEVRRLTPRIEAIPGVRRVLVTLAEEGRA